MNKKNEQQAGKGGVGWVEGKDSPDREQQGKKASNGWGRRREIKAGI